MRLQKKKSKKKKLLSWAVLILVFGYLCASVFYFCALIIINGLLYNKKDVVSVSLTLTLLQGKNFFCSREIGGLVVCGYDGFSVLTLKKKDLLLCLPFYHHQIQRKRKISHYVLSIIWLWSFSSANQTWVKHPEGNPAPVQLLCFRWAAVRGDFCNALTLVFYNYVNTPVFLEKNKQFFYLKCVYCILLYTVILMKRGWIFGH